MLWPWDMGKRLWVRGKGARGAKKDLFRLSRLFRVHKKPSIVNEYLRKSNTITTIIFTRTTTAIPITSTVSNTIINVDMFLIQNSNNALVYSKKVGMCKQQ